MLDQLSFSWAGIHAQESFAAQRSAAAPRSVCLSVVPWEQWAVSSDIRSSKYCDFKSSAPRPGTAGGCERSASARCRWDGWGRSCRARSRGWTPSCAWCGCQTHSAPPSAHAASRSNSPCTPAPCMATILIRIRPVRSLEVFRFMLARHHKQWCMGEPHQTPLEMLGNYNNFH